MDIALQQARKAASLGEVPVGGVLVSTEGEVREGLVSLNELY